MTATTAEAARVGLPALPWRRHGPVAALLLALAVASTPVSRAQAPAAERSGGQPRPGSLEVTAVQGEVRSGGRPLAVGARLAAGDDLRSGTGGYVTLTLTDGSTLTLMPATKVRIERLQASRRSGAADAALHLERGRAEARVRRSADGATRFEIRTAAAVITAREAEFRVVTGDEQAGVAIEVASGQVAVRGAAGRGSIVVPAGSGTRVLADGAPQAPRALLPAPNLWIGVRLLPRSPATFEFSPLQGASAYRVLIATAAAQTRVRAAQVAAAAEVLLPALADGDYFVQVRGVDETGLEGRDSVARLRVRARIDPPLAANPPDRGRSLGSTVEFEWLPVPAVAGYTLQLARDPAFQSPVRELAGLREPNHVASGLPPGEYYWRVAGVMPDGRVGLFSTPRAFSVRLAPPQLPEPVVGDEAMTVTWSGAGPGQRFRLQLARDAAFADVVAEQTVRDATATLPRPAPGTYYLRLRTTDPDGVDGPFGAARILQVAAKRARPACLIEGPGGVCAAFAPPAAPR